MAWCEEWNRTGHIPEQFTNDLYYSYYSQRITAIEKQGKVAKGEEARTQTGLVFFLLVIGCP